MSFRFEKDGETYALHLWHYGKDGSQGPTTSATDADLRAAGYVPAAEIDRLRAENDALRRLAGARAQALLKADVMRDALDSTDESADLLALEYDSLCAIADECDVVLRALGRGEE